MTGRRRVAVARRPSTATANPRSGHAAWDKLGGMGIELELRVKRTTQGKGRRDVVIRGSHEHGEALARALDGLTEGRLAQVDPYRDTRFTEQDAQAALTEVAALVRDCANPFQEAALLDLAELLEACAATPGSCLWFIGD
ncbi:hypothetical protein ABZ079_04975 [Streptomyces sp. NPDC006314]|uniref:hypothetical protein n=1 Tax=Streptomyces sp. NPDC006314 TaxID=3154475 RepID=UPI0033A83A1B